MTLYRANQLSGTATALTSGGMQQKLLRYAQLLTSQGSLETALGYLSDCVDVSVCGGSGGGGAPRLEHSHSQCS